ncbi:MAG TPA: hypothetical protein VHP11_14430, partial [Tepidisphaeraceae bacterium]|nr:hypothetical protein [Tepidisphaeraceae bacterium]
MVLVGVMVAAGATLSSSGKKTQASDALIGTVANGPLTITVTESGTIRSRQQEIIKSQVEGTATILYLIPEGTRVKKGDLLVELDVTKVEDQKISQLIVVQNADASAISAEETLAVAESQAKSDIAKATLDRPGHRTTAVGTRHEHRRLASNTHHRLHRHVQCARIVIHDHFRPARHPRPQIARLPFKPDFRVEHLQIRI